MPYQANYVAAGGANASAFGPTAARTLHVPCFFSYGFLTHGQDIEMAHTSPPETRRTSHSAGRIRAEGKPVGWRRFGSGGFDVGKRDFYGLRDVFIFV